MSKAQLLVDLLTEKYGDTPQALTRKEVSAIAKEHGIVTTYRVLNVHNKTPDGLYNFPPTHGRYGKVLGNTSKSSAVKAVPKPVQSAPKEVVSVADMSAETTVFTENLIPEKDPLYVPFGEHKTVEKVIKSTMFFPTFITGLSGNGKTMMCEQISAKTKREVIRVNFTMETDEDDLIGGFRMLNGDTKFFKGPVVRAMELGAVLVLDEIDLGNPAKIMCLQSILEGKGYFIKKTGEFITPAAGFNIIATANTKGKGSEDGQFIGTNILNEAFLERFPVTCEQPYPPISIEKKILSKVAESLGVEESAEFIDKLVDWADIIRKTYFDGGVDSLITTRRLVHIIRSYYIFGDRAAAIQKCINRFDDETKAAFLDLYSKLDETVNVDDEDHEKEIFDIMSNQQ
jgi:MoxR-like ATPase